MNKLISRGEDLVYTLETLDTDVIQELVDVVSSMRDQLDQAYEEYQAGLEEEKDKADYFESLYAEAEIEKIKLLNIIKTLSDELELSRGNI